METFGIGLIVPAITLMTQSDIFHKYPEILELYSIIGSPGKNALVISGMLILVLVYFLKVAMLAVVAWYQNTFAFKVQMRLSQSLFSIYLHQPYTFHLERNSGKLIQSIVGEINLFASNGLMAIVILVTEIFTLVAFSILLLIVEPIGTMVIIIVFSFFSFLFVAFTRKNIISWGQARQYHDGLGIQSLQEGLGAAKDVKLLGKETEFLKRYVIHNQSSGRVARLQATLLLMPRLWLELLAVIGLALLTISMLMQGKDVLDLFPILGLFAAAAFRLMPSINRILNSIQNLRFVFPVVDVLSKEFDLVNTASFAKDNKKEKVKIFNELQLLNVFYKYPSSSKFSIENISFSIKNGESIGFIGASGAGKSTLVDILLGLLYPTSGEILLDGKDVHQNIRIWQKNIGYVPQFIFLTDDTLRRNVAFGLPEIEIDDEAVKSAIKLAQLEDFVAGLPKGLDTMVGERGVRLSGGQRQRIGIARALYHDPMVLVLDEATSSLDTATEKSVMESVKSLRGNKTIVTVAHRLSTISDCDRLYKLENGFIVDEGSPDYFDLRRGS